MKNQILFFKFLSLVGLLTMSGYSCVSMEGSRPKIGSDEQGAFSEASLQASEHKKEEKKPFIVFGMDHKVFRNVLERDPELMEQVMQGKMLLLYTPASDTYSGVPLSQYAHYANKENKKS